MGKRWEVREGTAGRGGRENCAQKVKKKISKISWIAIEEDIHCQLLNSTHVWRTEK